MAAAARHDGGAASLAHVRSMGLALAIQEVSEERLMVEKLISADNHIDLTYCPPDLWSEQAPRQWYRTRRLSMHTAGRDVVDNACDIIEPS